jgi:RNA polymerase sigma factor (sigma-70 family)
MIEERTQFEELYGTYYDKVFTYFYRRTSSAPLSLELTQDTFLRVFNNMKTFRYDCPMNFWIFKIAHNLFCSKIRSHKMEKKVIKEYELMQSQQYSQNTDCQESMLIRNQQNKIIMKALEELPEMMNKCTVFHILHELSYKEIAKLLNISVNTVKTHIREGKKGAEKLN